jgi:hypothetical protein
VNTSDSYGGSDLWIKIPRENHQQNRMSLYQNKPFWIAGSLFALVFAVFFMIRLDLMERLFDRPKTLSISGDGATLAKETWMNIFQKNRKIGFAHSELTPAENGYRFRETVFMRINTMGMVQDLHLTTRSNFNPDFSLADFDFEINSGRFGFAVKGSVADDTLKVQTRSAGSQRSTEVRLKKKPYLLGGITAALRTAELNAGDKYTFDVFDPTTMGQAPVSVEIVGREDVQIGDDSKPATKVALNFKGSTQIAWIDANGDVLREKGILGVYLEQTTREEALDRLALEASEDLTRFASVASNIVLENPERLSTLKVQIDGIALERFQLDGGRQTVANNVVTIRKELLVNLAEVLDENNLTTLEKIFLRPDAFIQSDHPKIVELAQEITGDPVAPLAKIRQLVDWVHHQIEKRPVLSLPDALSTLENRVGDCNEHAVLLAALARAAGIPCRVEAGLVYMQGRFYYHAWNLVYLGQWITVDSLFGQIPADVSHVRFITGSPEQQLDLMGIIGQVKLKVID